MSKWALITSAAYFVYRMTGKFIKQSRQGEIPHIGAGTDMAKCPRCYTYVPVESTMRASVAGVSMHFCSPECLEAYRRDEHEIDPHSLNGSSDNNNS